jgi:hypothetical protein
MKTRQPQLRAIPQFDSGRWKLRLEFVPVHPNNETTMGVSFESATQATVNETNEAHRFLLPIELADANDKHPVERIGRRHRLAKQVPTIQSRCPQSH